MSGPATVSFSFAPLGAVALSALALREAYRMGREYQDVVAEMRVRADELAQRRRDVCAARAEQRSASGRQTRRLEARLARQQFLNELSAGVTQAHALASEALLPQGNLPPIEEVMHAYAMQAALHSTLDESSAAHYRETVRRLLGRVELEPGEAIPAELESLGRELLLAPTTQRADLLVADLRSRIQGFHDERRAQRAEQAEAAQLLAAFADDASAQVQELLEDVLAGQARLLPETRALVARALDALNVAKQEAEQVAAAQVLEQSLRDLGYEVDGIEDTLFVEGGVAHFQRHGWGEYFVRMRIASQDKTINFNVVRAQGREATAERKRQDYLAEDRWCAEFPKLLQTLAARGINLDVTRLLGAGELPVQVVEPDSLPAQAVQEDGTAPAKPLELKR